MWCHGDSAVVTWGDNDYGGDSSAVRDQLKGVHQILASNGPLLRFWKMLLSLPGVMQRMAVTVRQFKISSKVCSRCRPPLGLLLLFWKMDPSFTWGYADAGGDNSAVRDQIKDVQHIRGHILRPFAWRFWQMDTVVTWGDPAPVAVTVRQFKISSRVCTRFRPHAYAFACDLWTDAIRRYLGLCRRLAVTIPQFEIRSKDVQHIRGHILRPLLRFWQMDLSLPGVIQPVAGDSAAVRDQLSGVEQIQAAMDSAFAAILADGSVVAWGDAYHGGDSSAVRDQLKDVQQIHATGRAFAAILADGSVVTWGEEVHWR